MSKRKADPADVLVNRLNVGLAKHKKLLASWSGVKQENEFNNGPSIEDREEEDFKDATLGYEQLGIGGKIPKEIQDGSFTRRTLTTNDKLLTQLMGKKAAKAHIAAQKRPQEAGTVKKFGTTPKPAEESEDEEEGRAATFKSKRRKTNKSTKSADEEQFPTDDPETSGVDIPIRSASTGEESEEAPSATVKKPAPKDDSDSESRPKKAKTGSYLDELLEKRSKKQKNKQKNKQAKAA